MLTANRQPGRPIELVLRRDDATDAPYTHPGEEARAAKAAGEEFDRRELFVPLPPGFWTQGWAIILSAPGLAMLLVMLVLTENGKNTWVWINPSQARSRFGLSEDTWSRGVAELRDHGLLKTRKKPVSEDFGWKRVRNTYAVNLGRLSEDPRTPPPEEVPARKPRRRPARGRSKH